MMIFFTCFLVVKYIAHRGSEYSQRDIFDPTHVMWTQP